jgi:SAM-dependent methyltransferase
MPIHAALAPLEHHQNRYATLLDQTVTEGVAWLDVGAGTQLHDGWLGTPQQSVAARASFLAGCDVFYAHLRKNPYLAASIGASVYDLPFADGSYDLVTANMVLEHLEEPAKAFSEIARVLRPGGAFLFVTPNVNNLIIRGASLTLNRNSRRRVAKTIEHRDLEHIFPTFYRANSARLVTDLAQKSGLGIASLETFYTWPFLNRIPVLRTIEHAYIIAMRLASGSTFGTNLLGVLRKQ